MSVFARSVFAVVVLAALGSTRSAVAPRFLLAEESCDPLCQCTASSSTTLVDIPPGIAGFGITITSQAPGCCDFLECIAAKCEMTGSARIRANPGVFTDMTIVTPGGGGGSGELSNGLTVLFGYSGNCGHLPDFIDFYVGEQLIGVIEVFCADC